jgi:hypothetical protein
VSSAYSYDIRYWPAEIANPSFHGLLYGYLSAMKFPYVSPKKSKPKKEKEKGRFLHGQSEVLLNVGTRFERNSIFIEQLE